VPRYETRRDLCRSGHDFGGCGKLAISAAPLEEVVREAVLLRLDGPALADTLANRSGDTGEGSRLSEQITQANAQLEELAQLYAAREITAPEWLTARKGIERSRADARNALARLSGSQTIDQHIGNGDALRRQWDDLP
jgi:site-specific DNA recombinase